MRAKDLTRIKSLDDLKNMDVGDLTWKPRENNSEHHRRGIITRKGQRSIEVTEHYYQENFDSIIEDRVYFMAPDSGGLISDTYRVISQTFDETEYLPIAEDLRKAGVKFKKR
jgi:hypothetical protein